MQEKENNGKINKITVDCLVKLGKSWHSIPIVIYSFSHCSTAP